MSRYSELRKRRREQGLCATCGEPSDKYRCAKCAGAAAARRPRKPHDPSDLERAFLALCEAHGLPAPIQQHRFAPPRRWRFDFAWPDQRLGVEVDGLKRGGEYGRHQRIDGILGDAEKAEAGLLLGWDVYRVPGPWLSRRPSGVADTIKALLSAQRRGWESEA